MLSALPRRIQARLIAATERVALGLRDALYEAGKPISHVYFPLSGVMSLVIEMNDKATIEVGTIGNEGMVGTPILLGVDRSPTRAFSQVPGEVLKMKADTFKAVLAAHPQFRDRMERYMQSLVNLISQSTACNHAHSIEQRMCRWLLMCHDRVGSDQLLLTQEFLSQMLGVRRPSVTVVAGLLQQARLIEYSRGKITVLNRRGLESGSCECYEVVRTEYERLMG